MQITEQKHKAVKEIFELIVSEIGTDRVVVPVNAIASCARLGGSFMFRSFNFSLKDPAPGQVVLSEEANEKYPKLVNVLVGTLVGLDTGLDTNKLNETIPEKCFFKFLNTISTLQNKALIIMNNYSLDYEQMAFSCAVATALIVKECQQDLALELGCATAIYGFIEGCKTYTPEFSDPTPKKKSFFKFWK